MHELTKKLTSKLTKISNSPTILMSSFIGSHTFFLASEWLLSTPQGYIHTNEDILISNNPTKIKGSNYPTFPLHSLPISILHHNGRMFSFFLYQKTLTPREIS